MKSVLIVLSATVLYANACLPVGGGSGPLQPFELSSTPKFRLQYSPPIGWTVTPQGGTANANQSSDAAGATQKAVDSINDAFKGAFTKFSAPIPSNFKINTDKIVPQTIAIAADPAKPKANEGIVELGVVSKICQGTEQECTAGNKIAPLILDQTISIENGPLLTGDGWSNVANEVYTRLTSTYGLYFRDELIAEKN